MFKKVISTVLSAAMIASVFCGLTIVSAETENRISIGETDIILISDDPTYVYGSATGTGGNNLISSDSFNTPYSTHNGGVAVAELGTNWRWYKDEFYPAFTGMTKSQISSGKYYYYCPNVANRQTIPEIILPVSEFSDVSFKISIRSGTASWSDVSVEFSADGIAYASLAPFYTASQYYVDVTDNPNFNTVDIRTYTIPVSSNGYLRVKLPTSETVINNTTANALNGDGWAFLTSSVLMSTFECSSNRMTAGVSDVMNVTESGNTLHTDDGRFTVSKNGIESLAELNDAVCASKICVPNWRWVNAADFTGDVAASGTYIYSGNCWNSDTVPEISYTVSGNTKLTFKVILRTESNIVSFDDVHIVYSAGSDSDNELSSSFISYTDKTYDNKLTARSYTVYMPQTGLLKIRLPKIADVKENTISSGLNSDACAFCASSVLMTPAVCEASDINYMSVGDRDYIIDTGWYYGTRNTAFGTITGRGYTEAIDYNSGWEWGNSNGGVQDILPQIKDDARVIQPDKSNPQTIKYYLEAGATLVVPVMMKSTLWDTLTESNNYLFTVDSGSGANAYNAEYVQTQAKWSDSDTIKNVLRKYSIKVNTNSVVTVSFPQDLAPLIAASDAINNGSDYFHRACAFIYPAYCEGGFNGDTITKRTDGTQIHDNLYFKSDAISSNVYAFSGGIATTKVVKDWHWPDRFSRFYELAAGENEYVYTTAYNNSTVPEVYYRLDAKTTLAFSIGILENAASWSDVKIQFSQDGINYSNSENMMSMSESYNSEIHTGIKMVVKYCEFNTAEEGYLKISLPVGAETAANIKNNGINDNDQLTGYSVFMTPAKVTGKYLITGDLDRNDEFTAADLASMRKILLLDTFNLRADINRDNIVNVKDLIRIKKYFASPYAPSNFSLESVSMTNDKIMTSSLTPTFSWEESQYASSYNLQIEKYNEASNKFDSVPVSVENINSTSYTLSESEKLESGEYYRWRVIADSPVHPATLSTGTLDGNYKLFLSNTTDASNANNKGMSFNGMTNQTVLNYLSRAMTYLGDSSFMQWSNVNADGEMRMRDILYTGTKYVSRLASPWGSYDTALSADAQNNQSAYLNRLHSYDSEIIAEACIFEYVDESVNKIAIPSWVFEAFGKTAEARNFKYDDMINIEDEANLPDITKEETQLFFYYCARTYINLGYEGLHFGQINHIAKYDSNFAETESLFVKIRQYAATNARRNFVFINAHASNKEYKGPSGKLLFDFHSYPLRAAYADTVNDGDVKLASATEAQEMYLQAGHLDSIYGKTNGGTTYYGLTWDSIPYYVEFDNADNDYSGFNIATIDSATNWGRDDISWFAHQPDWYRRYWLEYANDWVTSFERTDEVSDNGFVCMPGYRPANGVFGADYDYYYDEYNYDTAYYYMCAMNFCMPADSANTRLFSDVGAIRAIWNGNPGFQNSAE